jgi:hypothetical protein
MEGLSGGVLAKSCGRGGMCIVNQEHEEDIIALVEDVNMFTFYP